MAGARAQITISRGTDAFVARVRRQYPDWDVVDQRKNRTWPIDVLLLWFFLFGIWPLAHPDHNFHTLAGSVDLIVHWTAAGLLGIRWRIQRRYH